MDATIAAACTSETRAFCAREVDLLALVATRATGQDDNRVRQRRQRVRECLVDHADDLSADCVSALVGNVATEHSALPVAVEKDGADKEEVEAKDDEAAVEPQDVETPQEEEDEADEATHVPPKKEEAQAPRQKPVIVKLPPKEYTATPLGVAQPQPLPQQPLPQPQYVQPQPQYVPTSGDVETGIEVRIFLVNHPGQAAVAAAPPATPSYIRIGGDAAQHVDGDNAGAVASTAASGFTMSPWIWVMVLPFMCIGMYVSAMQTVAFVRRRRDVVYRVGAAQYMPIPTSLSATKQ